MQHNCTGHKPHTQLLTMQASGPSPRPHDPLSRHLPSSSIVTSLHITVHSFNSLTHSLNPAYLLEDPCERSSVIRGPSNQSEHRNGYFARCIWTQHCTYGRAPSRRSRRPDGRGRTANEGCGLWVALTSIEIPWKN